MNGPFLAYAGALVSGALALAVLVRRNRLLAQWAFIAGMLVFAAANVLYGIELSSVEAGKITAGVTNDVSRPRTR